jgi:hypothetical protein
MTSGDWNCAVFSPYYNHVNSHHTHLIMLNRSKPHHDKNWPASGRHHAGNIPWHDTGSHPVRRGRLTTLDALELIRRRFEAARHRAEESINEPASAEFANYPKYATDRTGQPADHEQQAA